MWLGGLGLLWGEQTEVGEGVGGYLSPGAVVIRDHKLGNLEQHYSLVVLEARSLKSRCHRATLPLKSLGKNPPFHLLVSHGRGLP